MVRNCPGCGLVTPLDAERCVCGHDFKTDAIARHGQPQSARRRRWRSVMRWLASLAFLGLGVWYVIHSSNVVFRGTPIPFGYFFVFLGGLGVLSCLFGFNMFRGGPLDMRND